MIGFNMPVEPTEIDRGADRPPAPNRRTIIKGAAWSVPVIAAASIAPMAAASGPTSGSKTFTVPAVNPDDYVNVDWPPTAGRYTFTVPAGVTVLSFTVIGGRGGGEWGGWPAEVSGTLPVTSGETLDIIVGNGGSSNVALGVPRIGGEGYGNGGSSNADPGDDVVRGTSFRYGTSGGGGSAILRLGDPLVVAGGGGGAPGDGFTLNRGEDDYPAGGDADHDAADRIDTEYNYGVTGGKCSGAGGTKWGAAQGWKDGITAPAGSRDGADGVLAKYHPQHFYYPQTRISSGGGGGYQGGGSGAIAWIDSAMNSDGELSSAHMMGAAGGGTSYLAPGVNGTIKRLRRLVMVVCVVCCSSGIWSRLGR
ncbi:hypothetical protein SAMN05443377_1419 [Propionibacterium cyclohexanicum]|uniref:Glycine rich protein n=1 Tax=Propionibacterium cyclohexanicum TaxID=64702 RepID=A0A1H9U660_9ACTN|nr:hypothetical protein [Propionibacterium cyclohexanicum]SES04802.1 hypothetical protein SAMN05443377_1419 [Propionibacterium cyclohexanicum]